MCRYHVVSRERVGSELFVVPTLPHHQRHFYNNDSREFVKLFSRFFTEFFENFDAKSANVT